MKNTLYFIIILISLSLWTCSKDDPIIIYEAGPQTDGWATGLKGGQEWEASCYARKHGEDSTFIGITFNTYNQVGAIREHYSTNEIPLEIGYTTVKYGYRDLGNNYVGASGSIFGSDGDLQEAFYETINDKEGFVKITSIDPLTNMVTGEFELFLKLKYSYNDSNHPDKLKLTEGTFEVRIIN